MGGSTSPIETFTGNGDPYAISLAGKGKPKGEVVESDLRTDAVYAYAPGSYTPYATLTNRVELPTGLLIVKPYKPGPRLVNTNGMAGSTVPFLILDSGNARSMLSSLSSAW